MRFSVRRVQTFPQLSQKTGIKRSKIEKSMIKSPYFDVFWRNFGGNILSFTNLESPGIKLELKTSFGVHIWGTNEGNSNR